MAQLQQDVAQLCLLPDAGGLDIAHRRAGQMDAESGVDGFGQPVGARQRVALGTHNPQHQELAVVPLQAGHAALCRALAKHPRDRFDGCRDFARRFTR